MIEPQRETRHKYEIHKTQINPELNTELKDFASVWQILLDDDHFKWWFHWTYQAALLPRECISNPVVLSLMVDTPLDGHWIDGSTLSMLSALTKSVEQTGKCTFNSLEPLFLVPHNAAIAASFCSRILTRIKKIYFIYITIYSGTISTDKPRHLIEFTFHEPRMEYHCAKLLYLHITVTTGLEKTVQNFIMYVEPFATGLVFRS